MDTADSVYDDLLIFVLSFAPSEFLREESA